MRAGRILKKLTEQGFTFQFIGSPEDDVCMVQRFDESACLGEATLYACEAACRPHFTQSPARVFPCLMAKDSFDCGKILQAVSQILRDERREEMNFLALYRHIAEGNAPVAAIYTCEAVMGNPCALLEQNLAVVVSSSLSNKEISSIIANEGAPQHSIVINGENGVPSRRYILCGLSNCEYKEEKYFCVLERNRPFSENEDFEKALKIARALSGSSGQIHMPEAEDADELLYRLIDGSTASPESIVMHLKALNWQFSEKYYVFTVDLSLNGGAPFDQEAFERVLGVPFFSYRHYRVALLRCRKSQQLSLSYFDEVSKLLTAHKLKAGISHGFYDISRLKLFFKQSLKSIQFGLHYDHVRPFDRFEDLPYSNLIEAVVKHDGINLLDLCHPLILDVYEYDKKNGTDYLNSLTAYIMMGQSINKAAELLHMHKNTIYARVKKLEEDFYIDFKDTRIVSAFRFAIMVFSYLGIVDTQDC